MARYSDSFTDVGGTLLPNHVPTLVGAGPDDPFAWLQNVGGSDIQLIIAPTGDRVIARCEVPNLGSLVSCFIDQPLVNTNGWRIDVSAIAEAGADAAQSIIVFVSAASFATAFRFDRGFGSSNFVGVGFYLERVVNGNFVFNQGNNFDYASLAGAPIVVDARIEFDGTEIFLTIDGVEQFRELWTPAAATSLVQIEANYGPGVQRNSTIGFTSLVVEEFAVPATGSLALTVAGLPVGADADITISGPGGFTAAPTATELFTLLVDGTYTINAAAITFNDVLYTPTLLTQTVDVVDGGAVTATVTYEPPCYYTEYNCVSDPAAVAPTQIDAEVTVVPGDECQPIGVVTPV